MTDVHDSRTRSRNMSAISSKNTRPELTVRKILHSSGYRYRINVKRLRGKPDICLLRYNVLIFVHGCSWHHHDCHLFAWPKTRISFWQEKINTNAQRDHRIIQYLKHEWRIVIVWECAIKGKTRLSDKNLESALQAWLQSKTQFNEISGTRPIN